MSCYKWAGDQLSWKQGAGAARECWRCTVWGSSWGEDAEWQDCLGRWPARHVQQRHARVGSATELDQTPWEKSLLTRVPQGRWKWRERKKESRSKRKVGEGGGGKRKRKKWEPSDKVEGFTLSKPVSLKFLTEIFKVKEQDHAVHPLKGSLSFDRNISLCINK